jgi:hypothetical protein
MFAIQYLTIGATALHIASAFAMVDDWPAALLKRQEPGTNAYNCHDNCGM